MNNLNLDKYLNITNAEKIKKGLENYIPLYPMLRVENNKLYVGVMITAEEDNVWSSTAQVKPEYWVLIDINNDNILVVYIPDIHESLAGIIAGRVKEKYNKPTIILTKSEDGVKGSARSIEEYNMFEGLLDCKELLDKFGGHPMAAGLSLQ